ncbi:cytochrome c3 family protein [Aquimarina algiphila]|uniref:cytochrome c3 family protein n=1 Tax=Aquimarina algiphila TaxID=2047982 RepID=UPI002490718F|nr:cytochrome c3 family protein [Aquimarina algiphila]
MLNRNPLRKRQYIGTLIGITVTIVAYIILPLKQTEDFLSLGPLNTGHEGLSCSACHTDAKGSLIQQLQSNMAYTFGTRKTKVDFGTQNVDNKKCIACHDRPNDRHPTHRFLEPKFKDAIANINATQCETCHREHNDTRVVLAEANFCINCHYDLEVKNDPIDVPHSTLISNKQWNTCLQCHDFHGNHLYKLAEKIEDTIPLQEIQNYLKGGKDPFSSKKKHLPLSEDEWLKMKTKYTNSK